MIYLILLNLAMVLSWSDSTGETSQCSSNFYQIAISNDNYTGSVENGKNGFYLGPDDFLTVSFLGDAHIKGHDFFMAHNVVTARKEKFRFDILTLRYSHPFWVHPENQWQAKSGLGIHYRGYLAGSFIQNDFHKLLDLPTVNLPYLDNQWALSLSIEAMYAKPGVLIKRKGEPSAKRGQQRKLSDKLEWTFDLRFPSGIVPLKVGTLGSYHLIGTRFAWELLAGYHLYPFYENDYHDLIRSGFVGGNRIRAKIWSQWELAFGLFFFPAQNLLNDPLYKEKSHRYSPQISTIISWNSFGSSWRRLLQFL